MRCLQFPAKLIEGGYNLQNSASFYTFRSDKIYDSNYLDAINESQAGVSFQTSSIPNPFSILHAYDSAFAYVAKLIRNGHPWDGDRTRAEMVSDILDVLQFLFERSDLNNLIFRRWNINELNNLGQFGNTIQRYLPQNIQFITLIYLYDNGQEFLLGGTSPLTMVYLGPNAKNLLRQNNIYLRSVGNDDTYFDSDIKNINQRPLLFQRYLCTLANEPSFKSIRTYLIQSLGQTFYDEAQIFDFTDQITPIVVNNENFFIGSNIILNHKALNNQAPCLTAIIRPQKGNYGLDKAPILIDRCTEQELENAGIRNINYDTLIFRNFNQNIPGTQERYPWVCLSTFFTESVYCISTVSPQTADLDHTAFYLGNAKYLPPLNLEFFQFFKPDWIASNLRFREEDKKLFVTLDIPMNDGSIKVLTKIYNENQIKHLESFTVNIFPKVKSDRYYISLAYYSRTNKQISINVIDEENTTINSSPIFNDLGFGLNIKTAHIIHSGSLTLLKVGIQEENGTIKNIFLAPDIKPYDERNQEMLTSSISFGIDFGTSNTSIAVKEGGEPYQLATNGMSLSLHNVNESIIYEKWASTVYGEVGYENYVKGYTLFEFNTNNSLIPANPFSTIAMLPNVHMATKPLCDYFVGFFYDEVKSAAGYKYKGNIKPEMERNPTPENRANVYYMFELIIEVCMAHAKLKGFLSNNINFYFSYPKIGTFEGHLRQICQNIFNNRTFNLAQFNGIPNLQSESICPQLYYDHLYGENVGVKTNTVNIDIGGGTTDICFKLTLTEYRLASVKFAGNNIWGGTRNNMGGEEENNPFLRYYKNGNYEELRKSGNHESILGYFDTLEQSGISQSLLINYLTKHEELDFVNMFIGHDPMKNKMRNLLLFNYAGLLYYTLKLGEQIGLRNIESISFSGKASKIITKLVFQENIQAHNEWVHKFSEIYKGSKVMGSASINQDSLIGILQNPKEITAYGLFYNRPGLNLPPDILTYPIKINNQIDVMGGDFRNLVNIDPLESGGKIYEDMNKLIFIYFTLIIDEMGEDIGIDYIRTITGNRNGETFINNFWNNVLNANRDGYTEFFIPVEVFYRIFANNLLR